MGQNKSQLHPTSPDSYITAQDHRCGQGHFLGPDYGFHSYPSFRFHHRKGTGLTLSIQDNKCHKGTVDMSSTNFHFLSIGLDTNTNLHAGKKKGKQIISSAWGIKQRYYLAKGIQCAIHFIAYLPINKQRSLRVDQLDQSSSICRTRKRQGLKQSVCSFSILMQVFNNI